MGQTIARIKKGGKHFEVVVDEEEALKFKKGEGDLSRVLVTDVIFHNHKSGDRASDDNLELYFETSENLDVAKKIIKNGEIVRTSGALLDEQEKRYKQVVDFLTKNATSPEGRPYTPDRFMKALKEAHVNLKNKPVLEQLGEIVDQLSKVLPVKIEKKKFKLRIPVLHTGRAYGGVKEFIIQEKWLENGDLDCVVEIPSGLVMDFFDELNNKTHGSVISEDVL
jgi:ribosome maturation protein SDO1